MLVDSGHPRLIKVRNDWNQDIRTPSVALAFSIFRSPQRRLSKDGFLLWDHDPLNTCFQGPMKERRNDVVGSVLMIKKTEFASADTAATINMDDNPNPLGFSVEGPIAF